MKRPVVVSTTDDEIACDGNSGFYFEDLNTGEVIHEGLSDDEVVEFANGAADFRVVVETGFLARARAVAASTNRAAPRARESRPRAQRSRRAASARRSSSSDDGSDPEPPPNGRRCESCGGPLHGKQKFTCGDACRKTRERRRKGVKPRWVGDSHKLLPRHRPDQARETPAGQETVEGFEKPAVRACFKCGRSAPRRSLHGAPAKSYAVALEAAKRSVYLCDEHFKPREPNAINLPTTIRGGGSYFGSAPPPGVSITRVDKELRLRELRLELPSANGNRPQIEAEIARVAESLGVRK